MAHGGQSIAKTRRKRKIDPARYGARQTLGPTARHAGAACAASGLPAWKRTCSWCAASVLQLQSAFAGTSPGGRGQLEKRRPRAFFPRAASSDTTSLFGPFLQRVVIDSQGLGRPVNPVSSGQLHGRSPQRLRNASPHLTGPSPPLESPSKALQPGRKAASLSGTHPLSSTTFCVDSQRYHTPQTGSYTLAGRTRPARIMSER